MASNIREIPLFRAILKFRDEKPLTLLIFIAVALRLVSVIFARGWGMLDDHFLVVESAQSWVDGQDANNWLPGSPENTGPTGHNFFYPGIHFLLFSFFRVISLEDPQIKMVIVRLLHAAWSLITVIFGYRIAKKAGTEKDAWFAGLLLASYWFMPWVSVRNMVEVFCIPFLVLAIWTLVKKDENELKLADFLLAGILLGFALNVRIQTLLFSAGIGLAYLIKGKWKEVLMLSAGILLPFALIQGTIDYFIWGTPFVEMAGYVKGNIHDATNYINQPWYNYFLVVLGFLLPPVSLFLVYGYLRTWRTLPVIFAAVAVFFIFHSIFPNKQERFILPVLPFIMITGVIGWNRFLEKISGKDMNLIWVRIIRVCWIIFWILNIVLLAAISTMYSKRSRVESMTWLSRYHDIRYFLVADEGNNLELFPCFYLKQWPNTYDVLLDGENCDSMMRRIAREPFDKQPRFILFTAEHDLKPMVISARKSFPFIVYETTIEPGFIDKVVKWLNPVNKNRKVYIYRNTLFYKEKIN